MVNCLILAIGCPDFQAPPNAEVVRESDAATISCTSSGRSYRLICEGNEWVGSVGDCPKSTVLYEESLTLTNVKA